MDPYYEQRLRAEVIYLHNLWRQGPPPRPRPSSTTTTSNLPPLNSTHFKKHKKKNPIFHTRQPKKVGSFSGTEWPVKPTSDENPPATQSGWPELKLKPKPDPPARLLTPEEVAKFNWNQVQQKALKAANDFFLANAGSDGEDDDEDDMDEDDDDDEEEEDDIEAKEYDFFLKMFNEEDELKGYYAKNCAGGGEFSCLVCGGANEKFGKRFKNCVALVQHSVSIAKTKKRRSHRAYGQVICKVLGWDINRLPSSMVSDFKSGESQGNDGDGHKNSNVGTSDVGLNKSMDNEEASVGVNLSASSEVPDASKPVDGESMVCEGHKGNVDKDTKSAASDEGLNKTVDRMDASASEIQHDKAPDVSNPIDGESMVCENSVVAGSLQVEEAEDARKQGLNEAAGTVGGAVNNLEPLNDNGVGGSSSSSGTKVDDTDVKKNTIVVDGIADNSKSRN